MKIKHYCLTTYYKILAAGPLPVAGWWSVYQSVMFHLNMYICGEDCVISNGIDVTDIVVVIECTIILLNVFYAA